MMKDWQVDPLSGSLLHVDMLRIAMDVRMRVRVPVHTFGEPQGVKIAGRHFRNGHARSRDRVLAGRHSGGIQGGRFAGDDRKAAPRRRYSARSGKDEAAHRSPAVIAHVVTLKKEEEPTPEAAVAAETAPAEPEVIKKGKKEEEGEGEGAAEARRRPKRRRRRSKPQPCRCARALKEPGATMRLIVGLGNPGRVRMDAAQLGFSGGGWNCGAGAHSHHAAGRQSAGGRGQLAGQELILAKPQTFMNLSGVSVRMLLEKYELDPAQMIVLVDDVDLPWGSLRIRERGRRHA